MRQSLSVLLAVAFGVSCSGGPSAVASLIQVPPTHLLSDGDTLFWSDDQGDLSSLSLGGGGQPKTLLSGKSAQLLAVDSANVYYLDSTGLERIPKTGGSPSLVSEAGAQIRTAAILGARAFWTETGPEIRPTPFGGSLTVKTALLPAGSASVIGEIGGGGPGLPEEEADVIAVTSSAIFLSNSEGVAEIPIGGSNTPDGGAPPNIPGSTACQNMLSDTSAVLCSGASLERITTTETKVLGTVITQGTSGFNLAIDDTYVYWSDDTMVGTIMRVAKTGGAATIIARDTSPIALAVDANAVYWSDTAGNIMSLSK